MKNRKSLYTSIALLFAIPLAINSAYVLAESTNLADDIENPDQLLKIVDPEKKNARYGESNIVVSGDGDKHNEIVTPDPLVSSTSKSHDKKHAKDIELKPQEVTEDDKAIESPDPLLRSTQPEKKASRSSSSRNSDLETSDPLLDNMN